jgi:hypothetical protein
VAVFVTAFGDFVAIFPTIRTGVQAHLGAVTRKHVANGVLQVLSSETMAPTMLNEYVFGADYS